MATLKRLSPHVSHIAVALGIVTLIGLSGPMVAQTKQNANDVLARTSGEGGVVDKATSAYIAANVASGLGISVAGQVSEHSESLSTQSQLLSSDSAYLRKASAVATDSVSRSDIRSYTVKSGEDIDDIARKFGITTNTIRWANDINPGAGVDVGAKLTILPVNGVLHEVQSGDTADKLAEKYEANATQIISFNDAEVDGLKSGQKIVIPNGTKPAPQFNPTNSYFANAFVPSYGYGASSATFVGRSNGVSGGDNRHFGGQCTWYVAERKGIYGETWGHASQWANSAVARNIPVSTEPRVGAIAQRGGGYGGLGHVGIVEELLEDGRIRVRSMNLSGVWNIHDEIVAPSSYSAYIYR
ncbi:MAG: LysM peptidoglycan-binding domain-containing protein [Candidatus Saccharimonadales bacterium]